MLESGYRGGLERALPFIFRFLFLYFFSEKQETELFHGVARFLNQDRKNHIAELVKKKRLFCNYPLADEQKSLRDLYETRIHHQRKLIIKLTSVTLNVRPMTTIDKTYD